MDSKKEVLTIDVKINEFLTVKGTTGEATMILFTGHCNSELFHGEILPGGVDTQKQWYGKQRELSARYILDGIDFDGKTCKLFIENNGFFHENGNLITQPKIFTDSKALAFLENATLTGTIEGIEGGVRIHIFDDNVM